MKEQNAYVASGINLAASMLNVTRDEIRLACGEMTDQEMRTVLAVLNWRKNAIYNKSKEIADNFFENIIGFKP